MRCDHEFLALSMDSPGISLSGIWLPKFEASMSYASEHFGLPRSAVVS